MHSFNVSIQARLIVLLLGFIFVDSTLASDMPAHKVENRIAVFGIETADNIEAGLAKAVSEAMGEEISRTGKYEVLAQDKMDKTAGGRQCQANSIR